MGDTKMPKLIYVRVDHERGEAFLVAYDNLFDLVQDEGKTTVGVYEFQRQDVYRKVVSKI